MRTVAGLLFSMCTLLAGCGGADVRPASPADHLAPLQTGNRCSYIGKSYRPTLDIFCSIADAVAAYPALSSVLPQQGTSGYFNHEGRQILVADYIGDSYVDGTGRIQTQQQFRSLFRGRTGSAAYQSQTTAPVLSAGCRADYLVMEVATRWGGPQRLFEYCACSGRDSRRVALYLEGHGGSARDIGLEHMDFLCSLGYRVFYSDMPLIGTNQYAVVPEVHDLFGNYETARPTPVYSEFLYPVGEFISALRREADETVLMGRSGGGWRAYTAGALFDVDYVIAIAGGTPLSLRLSAPAGVWELGDWEQWTPSVYQYFGHEDFMRFAGNKGAAYIYNKDDPCCFGAVRDNDPFVAALRATAGRNVNVFVDLNNPAHSLGPSGGAFVRQFLGR
jgi:hypothetical protein